MTRREYYESVNPEWDGICVVCGTDYFEAASSGGLGSTCLSCVAQYQGEQAEGLEFDEDENWEV
jgi:hypothetical protein